MRRALCCCVEAITAAARTVTAVSVAAGTLGPGGGCATAPATAAAAAAPINVLQAEIWTGDASIPRGAAVTWRGGRIGGLAPSGTMIAVDGTAELLPVPPGAFVVPGLVDAHAHLYGLGQALMRVDLRGDARTAAIAAKIAQAHAARPPGDWILGRAWDQNLWSPPAFPSRQTLDQAAPGRPVWLRRVDGHAGWASSEAMRLAGVTRATEDPPGGRIVRGADGEPTGVFIDRAMELVEKAVPDPSPGEIERAILLAQDHVLARGLTGVHEMGITPAVEAVYRRLAAGGRLRVRVYAFMSDSPAAVARLSASPPEPPDPEARFTLAGIKLYVDGALGSRGAALLGPYADEPAGRSEGGGLVITPQARLAEITTAALRTGWQVAVHAIGDRGNRMVLDAFEQALRAVPSARDPRLRIEHAQILDPGDIPRFAKLGVIASMQPTHATSDMPWVPARLGADRVAGVYAWQSLLQSGARLCAGSDFPVELADPVLGLAAAVTRQDGDGRPEGGWLPAERLSADQALAAFTTGAAFCGRRETVVGALRPGALADITVLDRDITAAAAADIRKARVLMTIVGGKIEYRRDR